MFWQNWQLDSPIEKQLRQSGCYFTRLYLLFIRYWLPICVLCCASYVDERISTACDITTASKSAWWSLFLHYLEREIRVNGSTPITVVRLAMWLWVLVLLEEFVSGLHGKFVVPVFTVSVSLVRLQLHVQQWLDVFDLPRSSSVLSTRNKQLENRNA